MNYIWNKNVSLLKTRFSALYKMFEEQFDVFQKEFSEDISRLNFWSISNAKNGELTATENQKLLHSSYNPSREAQSIAPSIKEKSNIIFLGFGLGYHVIEAAKQILQDKNKKKLIIIESDLLHFFASLSLLSWEEVFKVENLVLALACPVNQIIPLIENQNNIATKDDGVSDSFIFALPAFTQHDEPYFKSVIELIERNKTKNEINSKTFQKFAKLWIKNSIKNISQIEKCPTVNEYLKNNKDDDFIVLGAGPSLKNIFPYLKELKSKYKIICVETALNTILKNGVEPDFIIITDPQYYAYRHIQGLKTESSFLIAPLSVHPGVFRFKCKGFLLCSDMIPLSKYFENKIGEFGDLGAGGSVASCAWNFARLSGAKNIYLAGLDLSYPQKQTHIKGSSAEQKLLSLSTRVSSLDKLTSGGIYSAISEPAVDYSGNKVITDSRMKMFAWWFESKIQAFPETKTYTLCKESMKIPGVEYCSIESLLKKENVASKGEISTGGAKDISAVKKEFIKDYKNLLQNINRAVELCMINPHGLDAQLEKIDAELFNSPFNELIRLSYKKEENKINTYLNMKKLLDVDLI